MNGLVASSTQALTADITLIREVVSQLTRKPPQVYVPGRNRRAYRCPHCKGLYTAKGIRVHIPRCNAVGRKRGRTYAETVLGALPVSHAELTQAYALGEYLDTGSQGAD